jgi:hypothetical protein
LPDPPGAGVGVDTFAADLSLGDFFDGTGATSL